MSDSDDFDEYVHPVPDEYHDADRGFGESDDYDDDPPPDPFDEALGECGMTQGGDCMLAGTEFCDWECPIARMEFEDDVAPDDEAEEIERLLGEDDAL